MSSNSSTSMDYAEHERTYEGFINFSKIGTIAVLTIVITLAMFAFGGTAAVVFGWILTIANLVAIAAGMALGEKGWIPAAGVFVLAGLLALVTI
ncbi:MULTISPECIES: aa3-type cytochrome c oxidase subunit IV [Pannonibacter]|uniref:aa3-type cytochrome c oxidase subunit IV n=1 Tax=Pannonibacter TaxID=227873 RepID=UPI0018E4EFBE|nr:MULTISPECIES: aa3-type cytochrome c oxidase subunit IV [Pannonibacter]MCY1704804.1 aa3-type cytochrome c oxidase subunit IV [Pannonibacter sp. SL95]